MNLTSKGRPFLAACALISVAIAACSKTDEKTEFVAEVNDFQGYTAWTKMGTKTRTDNNQFRTVYINKPEEANRTSGAYPVGTIIVKEIRQTTQSGTIIRYQNMVKRGEGFNPDGNGWEWFLFDGNELSVTTLTRRGDNTVTVGGNTCISCHTGQNDLVFGKARLE